LQTKVRDWIGGEKKTQYNESNWTNDFEEINAKCGM